MAAVSACGGGNDKPAENPTTTPSATPSDADAAAPTTSATPSTSGAPSTSAAPSASAAPAKVAWKDMTPEQKGTIMKNEVLPKLGDEFKGLDAKHYAEFNCKTCHGKDAKERNFKMPNPSLPKLPADPAGFKTLAEKKPAVMKFMSEKVKPDMAGILGVEQFEPGKNEKGFGCFNCHEKKS
jgi:hypothetical protein